MTEQLVDVLTLGGGALSGKAFSTLSFLMNSLGDARKEAHDVLMAKNKASEASMKRAEKASGGTWMRRGIYGLVAFAFISIVIAGWMGQPIVIENTITKGMLFWKREVLEYTTINGVPFLDANKTAFLAIVSFYLGSKV